MAAATDPKPLISPGDMPVVERVLEMSGGYVLDFSDRTFDEFVAHEIGIDATAPRYAEDGTSKAKRLRRIIRSLAAGQQARLLRALLKYRDAPVRTGRFSLLDDEWRRAYDEVVLGLEQQVVDADTTYAASSWTGRRTIKEQVAIIRGVAPVALREIDELASIVENKRFNDPITADAVQCLRELHRQLGDLITAIDRGSMTRQAVEAIEANREMLARYLKEGAKLTMVAPTMTFGIMHVLAWITGVPIDSTLVSTVFGAIVGADALKSFTKKSSISP